MADFLDIFGEDFSSVLASLDELPPEVETMLLGVMDKMVYDVRTFSNGLEKSVFSLTQAGASQDIIKQTLTTDMETGGRIFGELRNNTKASVVDGINQSAKMGQYQNYDLEKGEFVWVVVGGHKVCPDCDARGGFPGRTFAEWESEGLPGSGWSVCQGFCYCVLDPTGKMTKKIEIRRPGETALEKRIYRPHAEGGYGLTKQQIAKYEKVLKLNTPSSEAMLKRLNISKQQVYIDFARVRGDLSKLGHTKNKHFNKRTGKYTKARAKLHEQIARDIVNKGKIATGDPEFLMTGGYPGSGKSTMLDQAFPGWKKKFVHIDSDKVKDLLARYDGMDKVGWRAAAYHEESDAVLARIFDLARNENRHILFDGTMKNSKKMIRIINQYKEAGYRTTAAFADLPIEQSIERAIARFYGASGRFVDPIYIVTHGNKNMRTFRALMDEVDNWTHYNTNVPYKTPAILVDQSGLRKVIVKGVDEIDDLLGTAKISGQVGNIDKVTGRFGWKQKPPWQVWEEILETTDYKNDLAKYTQFLEENGLKGIADDLNILWKKQDLDGEAFFRYIASELDDTYTHFAHNKYMDHDAVLQAAFKDKMDKFIATYLKEKNIKLNEVFQAMKYDRQFNQNMLKRYGFVDDAGNVKVYRGVSKSYFDETGIPFPKDYGEVAQMAVNSAESWSTNATLAEKFASSHGRGLGIVFEAEVPLERVMGSNFSFAHMKSWDELKGAMTFSELSEVEIVIGGSEPVNVTVFEFGG